MELKIEYLTLSELKPYAKNAKLHDRTQIDQIKESIRRFGMNDPIAIWKNSEIIEGHGRLKACQEMEIESVPVIRLDHLTDQERRAYCLAHNQITMTTGFDLDLLKAELESLPDIDMEALGFEEYNEPEEEPEVQEDGFEPKLNEEPKTKKGQLWKLGQHRLLCGDSTDPEDMAILMDGQQADLYVTDPPYNVALGMGGSVDEARKRHRRTDGLVIMNDKMGDSAFHQFLVDAFKTASDNMRPGASFYIWHADNESYNFRGACRDMGWQIRQCIIWNKNTITLGRQDYQWKHEPCLYGWKDGAAHYFIDDRKQSTVIEDQDPAKFKDMKKEELIDLLKEIYSGRISTSVIENVKKPAASEYHPTMKPLKLIGQHVKNSSKPGELVLDSFGGSGSTLLVCEQLNRRCNTMELDPKYCDAIIERWELYTGEKAELIKEA